METYTTTHVDAPCCTMSQQGGFGVKRGKGRAHGFTLLELAVTMAIVSIMVLWGAPGLQRILENQRVRAVVSEFRSGFSVARFESFGQGRRLVIAKNCALTAGGATTVSSNCNGVNWSSGFTVFVCRSNAALADQDSALNALDSNAVACATQPYNFFAANTSKQTFEGFNRRVRLCSVSSNGSMVSSNAADNTHLILFNPNGNVLVSNGNTTTPARNLEFYVFEDHGSTDLAYRLSMSGDGQLTSKTLHGTDVNSIAGIACENL